MCVKHRDGDVYSPRSELLGSLWQRYLERRGEGGPGQVLPKIHLPGQEGGWVKAPWEPGKRPGGPGPDAGAEARTMVSPMSGARPKTFIFSVETELMRKLEAGSPAPAETGLGTARPALLTTDTWLVGCGRRKTAEHCRQAGHSETGPAALEAGRDASQRGPERPTEPAKRGASQNEE